MSRYWLAGLAAVAMAGFTAPAEAANLTVSGTQIQFAAGPGEDNEIAVSVRNDFGMPAIGIQSVRPLTLNISIPPGSPCRPAPFVDRTITCPFGSISEIRGVLGDRADRWRTFNKLPVAQRVQSGSGYDRVSGGSGNDRFADSSGGATLVGGGGEDLLIGGTGPDRLDLHESASGTANGGRGKDRITGSDGPDVISAGSRSDEINAGAGDDVITGGSSSDDLEGGDGVDEVRYDDNNQVGIRVKTVQGFETLEGIVKRGSSKDTVHNVERYVGGGARDRFVANKGVGSWFVGLGGNDRFYGSGEADVFEGGSGRDRLYGRGGDDRLFPGPNKDFVISGGSGNDRIEARDEKDEKVFCGKGSQDRVVIFDLGDVLKDCEIKGYDL